MGIWKDINYQRMHQEILESRMRIWKDINSQRVHQKILESRWKHKDMEGYWRLHSTMIEEEIGTSRRKDAQGNEHRPQKAKRSKMDRAHKANIRQTTTLIPVVVTDVT